MLIQNFDFELGMNSMPQLPIERDRRIDIFRQARPRTIYFPCSLSHKVAGGRASPKQAKRKTQERGQGTAWMKLKDSPGMRAGHRKKTAANAGCSERTLQRWAHCGLSSQDSLLPLTWRTERPGEQGPSPSRVASPDHGPLAVLPTMPCCLHRQRTLISLHSDIQP